MGVFGSGQKGTLVLGPQPLPAKQTEGRCHSNLSSLLVPGCLISCPQNPKPYLSCPRQQFRAVKCLTYLDGAPSKMCMGGVR